MKNYKTISLFIILIFIFIINILVNDRSLSSIESFIKNMTISTEKVLYMPFNYITDKIDEYKVLKKEYKKTKKILYKIKTYDLMVSKLSEKNKRIKELEEMLELKNNYSNYDIITSSVVNRSVNGFYQTLTIDKGYKDGIKKNMAVISNKGLIGKILNTTKNTSTVKLLTSVNNSSQISVLIETKEKNIYGLLSGYQNNKFIVSGISDNTEIENYSKVVTTGLDDIFPSGILVGYVIGDIKDNFDLEKTIYVSPSSSFSDINYVSVLKRVD